MAAQRGMPCSADRAPRLFCWRPTQARCRKVRRPLTADCRVWGRDWAAGGAAANPASSRPVTHTKSPAVLLFPCAALAGSAPHGMAHAIAAFLATRRPSGPSGPSGRSPSSRSSYSGLQPGAHTLAPQLASLDIVRPRHGISSQPNTTSGHVAGSGRAPSAGCSPGWGVQHTQHAQHAHNSVPRMLLGGATPPLARAPSTGSTPACPGLSDHRALLGGTGALPAKRVTVAGWVTAAAAASPARRQSGGMGRSASGLAPGAAVAGGAAARAREAAGRVVNSAFGDRPMTSAFGDRMSQRPSHGMGYGAERASTGG